ncbi:hypothetical protein BSL78_28365 [Apostichopus japonicus]|uniref:Uncharacterized protein n=1 Tax=Stichopus japonicus TaxID=307972 RepID=A0A2G8JGG8_STIJA|nr:hypothetical protein BSL78_28365 [Apostichopus japonicus]
MSRKPFLLSKDPVKSTIQFKCILSEPADNAETILDILHEKHSIGNWTQYPIVAGDAKTYKNLLEAKRMDDLNWLLPYLGEWQMLNNTQGLFMKIYLDYSTLATRIICDGHIHDSTASTSGYRFIKSCNKLQKFTTGIHKLELATGIATRDNSLRVATLLAVIGQPAVDLNEAERQRHIRRISHKGQDNSRMKNANIRQRLLREAHLTLTQAITIVRAAEAATAHASEIAKSTMSDISDVHYVKHERQNRQKPAKFKQQQNQSHRSAVTVVTNTPILIIHVQPRKNLLILQKAKSLCKSCKTKLKQQAEVNL